MSDCRTNLSIKCDGCGNFGHTIHIGKNRNNTQAHNVYTNSIDTNNTTGQYTTNSTNNSNISNNQFEQFLNAIKPLINNTTNNTNATNNGGNKLKAITVNPNGGYTNTG